MNTSITARHATTADLALAITRASATHPTTSPGRTVRRERDFGVGYGNSSGYAGNDGYLRTPSYVNSTATRLFRFG